MTTLRTCCMLSLLACPAVVTGAPGTTELVSVAAGGNHGAGGGLGEVDQCVSSDGRYVAFSSGSGGLVPDDGGGWVDVFVRDRRAGLNEVVTVAFDGAQANQHSGAFSMSANGRFVAFQSYASNLVASDTNGLPDIFVRDRQSGVTERVNLSTGGRQAEGESFNSSISDDGRYVAFSSEADNLVPGDTNGGYDVFVRDRVARLTRRVSVTSDGAQAALGSSHASITPDGRFVAFHSFASDLVPDDTNDGYDIFVHDRLTGSTERVNLDSRGVQSGGASTSVFASISADGRFVTFQSSASNLVDVDSNGVFDVFLRDRQARTTTLVSAAPRHAAANARSLDPSISANGRYVVFRSEASNLVAGDTNGVADVFIWDRETEKIDLVSAASGGGAANGQSQSSCVSADGRFAVFDSWASNLVTNDSDSRTDVFLREAGAADGNFTLKPAALEFGEQALFTGTTQYFWLQNKDASSLPVHEIGVRGADRQQFSVATRCGDSVAAGDGCRIRVAFRPTSVGEKSATLRVTAGDGEVRTRPLTGVGTAASAQRVQGP